VCVVLVVAAQADGEAARQLAEGGVGFDGLELLVGHGLSGVKAEGEMEVERWRGGEVERWRGGEVERWRGGKVERRRKWTGEGRRRVEMETEWTTKDRGHVGVRVVAPAGGRGS
jgi:hypothetical protein